MRVSFDLSNEFKKILEEYGHDVLVLRQDKKLLCSCYNEVTQEADRECPICLGLGYSFIAERHTTRAETIALEPQLAGLLKENPIGDVLTGGRKYYFQPNMVANEKDLIVEVDWDNFGRPSYKDEGIWKITNVDHTQDLGEGKTIYKVYFATVQPVRSKIRGIRISEINGVKQYNILLEG